MCSKINRILRRYYKLKKIDLSFNYLRSRLFSLLRGLIQPLEYINLQDCRLDANDVAFLNTNGMLKTLRTCKELNLSMNDFSQSSSLVFNIILNSTQLNCLSISYCQISIDLICQNLVQRILLKASLDPVSFHRLKMVYIQPFTPPKVHEIMDILHAFCSIKSLQKLCFLPSLYAFPGSNEYERESSALRTMQICASVLESKGRNDIDFIDPWKSLFNKLNLSWILK